MLAVWAHQQMVAAEHLVPLAISDFKNGVYSIGGVAKTLAQMWEANAADWDAYDPANVVAGVGLTVTSSAAASVGLGPVATAELLAALGPGAPKEYSAVFEYSLATAGGTTYPVVATSQFDAPNFVEEWDWDDQPINPVYNWDEVRDGSGASASITPSAVGVKKAAYMFCKDLIALSEGGGPVVSFVPVQQNLGANSIGISVQINGDGTHAGTATIRKITYYGEVPVTVLPSLSA